VPIDEKWLNDRRINHSRLSIKNAKWFFEIKTKNNISAKNDNNEINQILDVIREKNTHIITSDYEMFLVHTLYDQLSAQMQELEIRKTNVTKWTITRDKILRHISEIKDMTTDQLHKKRWESTEQIIQFYPNLSIFHDFQTYCTAIREHLKLKGYPSNMIESITNPNLSVFFEDYHV
jgi:hypothetical protein